MLKRAANVQWREQEDGNFIIHFDQDIFEANEITIRILELCAIPRSPEALVSTLLKEYEVEEAVLRSDFFDIVSDLQENRILEEVRE